MHAKAALLGTLIAIALVVSVPSPASRAPAWQRALAIRSDALNRTYQLGRYSVPRELTARTNAAWYRALEQRSAAMNERYALGRFAQATVDEAFDWTAAGIGAAVAAALCVLVAAAVVTARARLVARA